MNFLNPFILLGLAAGAIPVLLHLLNLRKLKTVEFSSLKFLKELQKSKIRRLKLKQILLLILRTLIIIFAVLAFSRPVIEGTIPGFETYSKTSIVILLDNSFSMDVSDEYGNRFTQAKKNAEAIIKSLKDGDEAVVIEMANIGNREQYSFTRNFDLLTERLNSIRLENTKANLPAALSYSSLILDDAMNFSRELFIITDAQKNIFEQEDSVLFANKQVGIYVIPIGLNSKSDIENFSVDSIDVVTRIFQIGKPVEINAIIRNHSAKEMKGVLASLVFNGQRVAQRTLDIPANESRTLSIAAPAVQSGAISAYIELETDALNIDNKRYFGFIIPDNPNIAIIGEPKSRQFLEFMFRDAEISATTNATFFNSNEFASIDLSRFECIILAEGEYRESDFRRLNQYVSNGGGALIFANDKTDKTLFEKAMNEFGFGNIQLKNFSTANPAQYTTTDKEHPLFDGVFNITADVRAVVESPNIFRAMPSSGALSIIEMAGGTFLSETVVGDGKLLYCAVAPNLDWSNFPLTSLFPVIAHRAVFYLSATESLGMTSEIGDGNILTIPKKFSTNPNFKVIDPQNNEIMMQLPILPNGALLPISEWKEPGNYSIYNIQGKVIAVVSLNLPRSESLPPIKNKPELEDNLNILFDNNLKINIFDATKKLNEGIARARIGTELWQLFLLLAILCAFAEMFVQKASKQDLE